VRDSAFGLRDLKAMTCRADFGLCRLCELVRRRLRAVDAVARGARQVAPIVRAAFPSRVRAAVVTGETRLVDLRGLHLFELQDVPLRVVVHVRLPRTMAALAPVSGLGRPRVFCLRVRCALERVTLVAVTRHTGVAPDVARLLCRRRCGRLLCWLCRLLSGIHEATRRDAEQDTRCEPDEKPIAIHVKLPAPEWRGLCGFGRRESST